MQSPPPDASPMPFRSGRAILMADVVEYVRLMEQDEADTVLRWQALDGAIRSRALAQQGGHAVKSNGDGMVFEFGSVHQAMACAADMQHLTQQMNRGLSAERAMWLRVAVAYGDVYAQEHDIQGRAVNLAARLMTLAKPGEVVLSANARDQLIPGLDAEPEDLGECYLKHLPAPVRAYRLRSSLPQAPLAMPNDNPRVLQAGVAMLPLQSLRDDEGHGALGDLLADEVIGGLSRAGQLHVISRLSTVSLARRSLGVREIGQALGVAYVVSGSYVVMGSRTRVHLEMARTEDQSVIWSESLDAEVNDVLMGSDAIVPQIVAAISAVVISQELQRAQTLPLPNLQSHSLLMAGIGLIHRSAPSDFERAREILELLAQRHARLPQAHAWLGKWHAMKAVQGLSDNPAQDAARALDKAHRALDADPQSSLALTMKGLVQGFMMKDLDAAQACYAQALAANPNEALAWLYTATLRGWQGRGEEAWAAAHKALALSPLDPLKYYFESLAAFAALAAGHLETATTLAERSLCANRLHTATHRTLVIARWLQGDESGALLVMGEMLKVEPGFSTARYLGRFPGGNNDTSREYARILRAAGAPA